MASYANRDEVATGVTPSGRRRRTVSCSAPEDDVEVQKFYGAQPKLGNPLKSTVCMDYHVLSRLEDDVKRAEMRQDNPESAIPTRGYEHEQDVYRTVEEYHITQQLPRSARQHGTGGGRTDAYLPPITPRSNRSRRPSRSNSRRASRSSSRQVSRVSSASNSPISNRHAAAQHSRAPFLAPPRLSPALSPWHGNASTPSRGAATRAPANGHLAPLDTPSRTEPLYYRDDGRVVDDSSPRHDRQLFLEAGTLYDSSAQQAAKDAERERRLRLAVQLADMMESAE